VPETRPSRLSWGFLLRVPAWTFTYTTEGDLATVTNPIGNTTTDPDDYTTRYDYDDLGQLRAPVLTAVWQ
jgi:hypothetical protein